MTQAQTPSAIAGGLSEARKRAVLAVPDQRNWMASELQTSASTLWEGVRAGLIERERHWIPGLPHFYRLTPLGEQVRAHLAQEIAK